MKKIGIMTFHGSKNSGSLLQAYALQKIIKEKYGFENEIINFSNYFQKRMYSLFVIPYRVKDVLRNIIYLIFDIISKYRMTYQSMI